MSQPNPIRQANLPGTAIGDVSNTTPGPTFPPAGEAPLSDGRGHTPLSNSVVTDSWLAINVLDKKYGAKGDGVTDDTGAVQSAINAASAAATSSQVVDVVLPSGYGFLLGQLAPKSGVRLRCEGAVIKPNLAAIVNFGLFGIPSSQILNLNRFAIVGGYWIGAGNETFPILGLPEYSSMTDVTVRAAVVMNWGFGPFYFRAPVRTYAWHNYIQSPGSTVNAINFVFGQYDPQLPQTMMAVGNVVLNAAAAAIALVMSTPAAPAGSQDVNFIASHNICTGAANGNDISGAIDLENSYQVAMGPFTGAIIDHNIITNNRSSGTAYAVTAEMGFEQVLITENRLKSTNAGIILHSSAGATGTSDTTVTNNRILAPTPLYGAAPAHQSGNRFASAAQQPSQGRATLVAGTVTVNTGEVIAGDNILLSRIVAGGTPGELSVGTTTPGTSFVINSSSASDTSTIYWRIDH